MNERPAPPPEGRIITAALAKARPKLTLREAARRAEISEARWRQITTGYVMVNGRPNSVVAPSETIARMAKVVGVTSPELREAGRADAALELQILEAEEKHSGKSNEEILDRSEALAKQIWAALETDPTPELEPWVRTLAQTAADYEKHAPKD